jgi:hypothetical protein
VTYPLTPLQKSPDESFASLDSNLAGKNDDDDGVFTQLQGKRKPEYSSVCGNKANYHVGGSGCGRMKPATATVEGRTRWASITGGSGGRIQGRGE